jgi:Rhodanese-related sulfurtransferase
VTSNPSTPTRVTSEIFFVPIAKSLDENKGFRDESSLRSLFKDVTELFFCLMRKRSMNACHTAAAMVAAGLPMPDVYIGSYSEWSRLGLPVVAGDSP